MAGRPSTWPRAGGVGRTQGASSGVTFPLTTGVGGDVSSEAVACLEIPTVAVLWGDVSAYNRCWR